MVVNRLIFSVKTKCHQKKKQNDMKLCKLYNTKRLILYSIENSNSNKTKKLIFYIYKCIDMLFFEDN